MRLSSFAVRGYTEIFSTYFHFLLYFTFTLLSFFLSSQCLMPDYCRYAISCLSAADFILFAAPFLRDYPPDYAR